MQILLACAKLMADSSLHRDLKVSHRPVFGEQADMIASEMCRYSVSELEEMLHINHDIQFTIVFLLFPQLRQN